MFGGYQYGYADFISIDHPNIKMRVVMAFGHNGVVGHEPTCENPDEEMLKLFHQILATLQTAN